MKRTLYETIALIDALDAGDPERAHGLADDLILNYVETELRDAYNRLVDRCAWWAGA